MAIKFEKTQVKGCLLYTSIHPEVAADESVGTPVFEVRGVRFALVVNLRQRLECLGVIQFNNREQSIRKLFIFFHVGAHSLFIADLHLSFG